MAKGAAGSDSDRSANPPPPSVVSSDKIVPHDGAVPDDGDVPSDGAGSYDGAGPYDGRPPVTTGDGSVWFFMAVGGFFVGQLLSIVILNVIAALNGHLSDLTVLAAETVPPAWVVIGGLVGLWIGFLGAVVLTSRWRGTGSVVSDMGLRFGRWDPLIGLGAGVGGQFILLPLLYLPWEHVDPKLSQELAEPAKHLTGGFPGVDLAVIAVLTVLVVPVVEELFFRGLVLRGCIRLFRGAGLVLGPVLAVTTTGILFGLAHGELLELLGLGAFGIVLSAMAYKFQRLGPGIFAHATFNLAAIIDIAHQTGMVR
jgi:uncharacterized protein